MINFSIIDINQFLTFLIVVTGIWIAFWIFLTDKKNKINQLFFLFTTAMLSYLVFSFFSHSPSQIHYALLWKKLFLSGVSLFFIATYFFSAFFPKEGKRHPILDKIVLITEILFLFLIIFSNFIIKDIEVLDWGTNIIWGAGKNIWFGVMALLTFLIVGQLFKKYFSLPAKEKIKAQYFLIGIFLFAALNIISNVIFPLFQNTFEYHYVGDYSAIFLLGFTAYAIVKRKLFDIKIILASTLVGLIAILLLLDIFLLTTEPSYQLFKGLIFFVFIYFGSILIKSVKEEVKRREEAEILSRAKSEFISMASHQLRTPLTVIKGYISMILDGSYGKIDVKTKRVLGNVSISTERLVKIIEDLLNISRIELGKMDLEKKPTDIKKMIDNICKEIKIKAQEKNLKLIWEKPKSKLPKLNIDELKIRQVIYNIVDNAIKYTQTGKVEIKLSRENSNLVINISDTGRGFSKKDNTKLFELFSRGEAGTDTFVEGTGMGLYVAKKFVTLHKGKIWADSKGKNKGSAFHIELPIK
jgi:signal transduction histidine kinase